MNDTAIGIIIAILATLVAALARLYLSARGDAIRAEVMLRTECKLREATELQLSQVEESLGTYARMQNAFAHREYALQCEIRHRDALIAHREAIIAARMPNAPSPMLDDQTKALVRLATSNPNENEQRSAAMLVCKRLREKIDA